MVVWLVRLIIEKMPRTVIVSVSAESFILQCWWYNFCHRQYVFHNTTVKKQNMIWNMKLLPGAASAWDNKILATLVKETETEILHEKISKREACFLNSCRPIELYWEVKLPYHLKNMKLFQRIYIRIQYANDYDYDLLVRTYIFQWKYTKRHQNVTTFKTCA